MMQHDVTPAQREALLNAGLDPYQAGRFPGWHQHNGLGEIFSYEAQDDRMILWVFEPDGSVRSEVRLFSPYDGWEAGIEGDGS